MLFWQFLLIFSIIQMRCLISLNSVSVVLLTLCPGGINAFSFMGMEHYFAEVFNIIKFLINWLWLCYMYEVGWVCSKIHFQFSTEEHTCRGTIRSFTDCYMVNPWQSLCLQIKMDQYLAIQSAWHWTSLEQQNFNKIIAVQKRSPEELIN